MSGLAKILIDRGFKVSGSDWNKNAQTEELLAMGININFGDQVKANITDDIDVLCYTAAVHPDNPEFIAAKEKNIPMLTRAELLGELMENYNNKHDLRDFNGGRYRSYYIKWWSTSFH